jgi:hypothetical protein
VEVRSRKYLNNIVEQDHRAIKRRCASMKGFKSFTNAAITLAGIELSHRIHKRQFSFGLGRLRRNFSLKVLRHLFVDGIAVAAGDAEQASIDVDREGVPAWRARALSGR